MILHLFCFLILIIAIPSSLIMASSDAVSMYTGRISSTYVNQGNLEDSGVILGLNAAYQPFSFISFSNDFYHAPYIHKGSSTTNESIVKIKPELFPFGGPVFGGGMQFHYSKIQNSNHSSTNTRYFPYGILGQSFIFKSTTEATITPWIGIGYEQVESDLSSRDNSVESYSVSKTYTEALGGVSAEFSLKDHFDSEFNYVYIYNYEENEGSNTVNVQISNTLYKGFGLFYKFQYSLNTLSEEITNSLGIHYIFQ